jgi:hypothetical protein
VNPLGRPINNHGLLGLLAQATQPRRSGARDLIQPWRLAAKEPTRGRIPMSVCIFIGLPVSSAGSILGQVLRWSDVTKGHCQIRPNHLGFVRQKIRRSRKAEQKRREREDCSRSLRLLLGELAFQPALQFGFVRAELCCVYLIHELLQLVGGNVVPHRFINPAELFIL